MTMQTTTLVELLTPEEWLAGFPILNELRTHLTEESFLAFMNDMTRDGYRFFALKQDQEIVAVAGVAFRTNFYYKKHLFVYDLVTTKSYRSHGYGKQMLEAMHQFALEHGCAMVALESGLQRAEAHRFYEDKLGYEKFCYSFKKEL